MGFRNTKQRAMVCHTLLKLVRMEKLFLLPSDLGDDGGPTGTAEQQFFRVKEGESILSSGEQTMLLLAWYFWNGHGDVRIGDIMSLEASIVEAVGMLIHNAAGKSPLLVDQWIDKWKDFDPAAEYFAS